MEAPIEVKVKVLPGGRMPEKKSAGAAAWDCYARISGQSGTIKVLASSEHCVKIPLGFAIELPAGYHAEIVPRSSMGFKTGLRMSNSVGVIDSDYRGEVCQLLDNVNFANAEFIHDGDRVAQMLIVKDPDVHMTRVETLNETERGEGGFGSTGVR